MAKIQQYTETPTSNSAPEALKTSETVRRREASRKERKRKENRVRLREMKQWLYFARTGIWISDPRKLHWHHTNPMRKTRKICHLISRSWERIQKELAHCIVLHEWEHLNLHKTQQLRTR